MIDNKYLILFLTLFSAFILCGSVSAASDTLTSDQETMVMNTQIPFVENTQADSSVKYYVNTMYGTAYVTDDGIYHSITGANDTSLVVKEEFLDEQGQVITFQPTGSEKGIAKVDFYIGNDSSKWVTGQSTWNSISLGEIYPGINVLLKAHGGNVEKIFQIAPGANPDIIKIRVTGADNINIDAYGNLNLQSTVGDVQLSKPIAYQDDEKIETNYTLNDNTYGFHTTTYNTTKTLTIDPILKYSSFLGGSKSDEMGIECEWGVESDLVKGLAVDGNGNIYILGITSSTDFPVTTGVYQTTLKQINNCIGGCDCFVSKLVPNGGGSTDLIYSTFIGGFAGEDCQGITIDDDGNIYITGVTMSIDFPTTPGAYQTTKGDDDETKWDSFVCKLTPNGNGKSDLLYSTYLGGNHNDYASSIALDHYGYIYITGSTWSTNFPTTSGAYQKTLNGFGDCFICKFTPSGWGWSDLLYSTIIGGSGEDIGNDIIVDGNDNIYITGVTRSIDFPTTPGAYQKTLNGMVGDCFICKLTPNGNDNTDLLYSTYLGGLNEDYVTSIALDHYGYIYITGGTWSTNFPTTSAAFQTTNKGWMDAFVAKIATNGWSWTDLRYSTYIGGTKEDFGYDITLNSDGDIYIIGTTDSSDFPVNPGSTEKPHGFGPHGYNHDSFVTKLVLNGYDSFRLGYTIFIGGSGDDWGKSIFVDDSGNIYITGTTQSEDFPTTNGAYQTKYGGGYTDVFVCKFSEGTMVPLGDQTIQGPFDFTRIKEILKQIADEIIRIFRGLWPIK